MWDVDGGEGVVIFVLDVVGGVVRVLVGVVVFVVWSINRRFLSMIK